MQTLLCGRPKARGGEDRVLGDVWVSVSGEATWCRRREDGPRRRLIEEDCSLFVNVADNPAQIRIKSARRIQAVSLQDQDGDATITNSTFRFHWARVRFGIRTTRSLADVARRETLASKSISTYTREGFPFVGNQLFDEAVVDQLQMLIGVAVNDVHQSRAPFYQHDSRHRVIFILSPLNRSCFAATFWLVD